MKRRYKSSSSYTQVIQALAIAISFIVCCGKSVQGRTMTRTITKRNDNLTPSVAMIYERVGRIPRGGFSGENGEHDVSETGQTSLPSDFEIIGEKIVYSGWRTILQRKVRMRNGKIADFDLVGVKTGEGAVLVFAWNTKSKTATLIREYMPASNRILWGLAAGLIEEKHGHNTELAARHELEEECHLKGGKWIPLLSKPAAMDKYAITSIQCYLVLDPSPEANPKPLDEEEDIEIVPGVTIPEILRYIKNGEMNLVGAYGSLLAIEKLRDLGEYENEKE